MMSSTDENKPVGKPGRRNRKAEPRGRKPDEAQSPTPVQLQVAEEPVAAPAAPIDSPPIGAAAPTDASPIGAVASAETAPVSLQTIANVYGDYAKKSFEETRSFVEKLTGARSLDKAVEIQTEFATQACENFVAEARKIRELHTELARQIFKPLEGLVAKPTKTPR
jgi:hypothetical protein